MSDTNYSYNNSSGYYGNPPINQFANMNLNSNSSSQMYQSGGIPNANNMPPNIYPENKTTNQVPLSRNNNYTPNNEHSNYQNYPNQTNTIDGKIINSPPQQIQQHVQSMSNQSYSDPRMSPMINQQSKIMQNNTQNDMVVNYQNQSSYSNAQSYNPNSSTPNFTQAGNYNPSSSVQNISNQNNLQGITPMNPKGMSSMTSQGMHPMNPQGMPPMNPQGMPPMNPQGMSPMNPQGMPPMNPQGMPPMNPQGMPPITPQSMPPMKSQGMPPITPQGMPPMSSQGMSPVAAQGMNQQGFHQMAYQQPPLRTPGYGNAPQQQTLSADKLPNAIEVLENNQNDFSGHYETGNIDKVPPRVTTDFTGIDRGVANPKFIRSTVYAFPTSSEIMKKCYVPFVLSVTPFAKLNSQEGPISISDMGDKGPIRCTRCKAYMSPLMIFIDGGRRFQCNLCGQNTEVPTEFFVHLEPNGRRMDCLQRPELCLGSYELICNIPDYCRNNELAKPPAFIFIIDVSYFAVKSGLLSSLCQNLTQNILPFLAQENSTDNKTVKPRVGFITYDRLIHFYNLSSKLTRPQQYIVSMLKEDTGSITGSTSGDNLVPLVDGFLVDVDESADQIALLLEDILENYAINNTDGTPNTQLQQSLILGPVIQAGMEALKAAGNCPGKLFVFNSCLPTADAPGKLNPRDDRTLLGTDKEKNLFACDSEYYSNLAKACVSNGVSIDLFVTPSGYMDIATLSELTRATSGNIFKYDFFCPASGSETQLINDLRNAVSQPCGFDAVMRVRTSLGTRVTNFLGNFSMAYTEDINLAAIDPDTNITLEINHNDALKENDYVSVQVAVLYTSLSGQRRVRIHNITYKVTSSISDLFLMSELDTIMNWMTKQSVQIFRTKKVTDVRQEISSRSANILAAYRSNYSGNDNAGELILPESLKLLPLYANCLMKLDFMQSENVNNSGTDLPTDERAYQLFLLNGMTVKQSQAFLYPRIFNLTNVEENSIPPSIRDSYEKLKDDSVYLLENGFVMYLWIGSNIGAEWLMQVFNCHNVSEISDRNNIPVLETPLSIAVHRTLEYIYSYRSRYLKLKIVIQGDKLENQFKKFLVEDRVDRGGSSYTEFVYHIHKEIRNILLR